MEIGKVQHRCGCGKRHHILSQQIQLPSCRCKLDPSISVFQFFELSTSSDLRPQSCIDRFEVRFLEVWKVQDSVFSCYFSTQTEQGIIQGKALFEERAYQRKCGNFVLNDLDYICLPKSSAALEFKLPFQKNCYARIELQNWSKNHSL